MQYHSVQDENIFAPVRSVDLYEGESHDRNVSRSLLRRMTDQIQGNYGDIVGRIGFREVRIRARVHAVVNVDPTILMGSAELS